MHITYANTNIFEHPERKVESKSPCLTYKTNTLNVGFI